MLMPLFTAESEIEPVYVAAVRVAEVTFTVKVALPPVATVAVAGETVNQPLPDARVTVGVRCHRLLRCSPSPYTYWRTDPPERCPHVSLQSPLWLLYPMPAWS